ncbi:MAG: transketolase C-terminal domain-containing protein [Sulfolobales archaeon]|nr:transketolase family protein [Sulfolobales archaeon]MDW7969263.1 transketolase C-terminal domain-containing protein [Sulfolobales archaeon]
MRLTFGRTLVEIGLTYSDLYVVDADSASHTMTSLFAENFPDRFVNVGISEQDLVGVASGLASVGKKVIASTYASFLMRAWEQIRNTVARAKLNVKFVGTHAGISNFGDGPSHQCFEDIALMRVIPGMKVIVPADSLELRGCLTEVVKDEGPAYIRIGRDEDERVYDECLCRLGVANVVMDGSDVAIVAIGNMVSESVKAAKELRNVGISAAVIDSHTVKPLDRETILKYAMKTGAMVVAEEHNVLGGLGSAVAEVISRKYPIPIEFVGVDDTFGHSARSLGDLRKFLGLTSSDISRAVTKVVRER